MPASSSTEGAQQRDRLAQALFCPARIALLGASDDPARLTSRPQRLLRRHGFAGEVIPIHPLRAQIGGERAYRSILDVPGAVDHAVIMLPATAVERAVQECCEAGVRVATIFSSGFAESGAEGRRRQEAIVARARAAGMRILGPNCLGVIDAYARVAISANSVLEHEALRPGGLSLVSQSGSMLGAILTRAQQRALGFSKLVSVGNECDVGLGETAQMLVDDPHTQAILLFLEAFRDADALAAAAQRAFAAGKPVIAFRPGRSAIARKMTTSHTGTLAGDDRVADAFFRAHGILRVDVFEALFETPQLVLGHRPPSGRRVGAVTVSAGAAAMVADRLGRDGIELVPLPARSRERLAARRIRVPDAALVDLPMGRADGGAYAAVIDELLQSDHCDVALAVLGSNAAHDVESVRSRILAAWRGAKPLAVFAAPSADPSLEVLQQDGVAAFRTPESCADAIRAYLDWRAPAPPLRVPADEAAALSSLAQQAGSGTLNELRSSRFLSRLGIAFAPARVVRSGADAVDLPFPVAAKVLSRDIPHKAPAGGVVLDIPHGSELRAAIDKMLATVRSRAPAAAIEGVLVQPMQRGMAQLLVGLVRDPQVGAVVLVAAGGTAAAWCRSARAELAPVGLDKARTMLEELPGLVSALGPPEHFARGLTAAAHVIHRLSLLACVPQVLEAEIDPLVLRADSVVAVDALVRLAGA